MEAEAWRPVRVDYTNPTFLNLDNTGAWDSLWRIEPQNFTSKDWVFLAIISKGPGSHPIHLHGHDFAVLKQAYDKKFNTSTLSLKFDNPPRRDVVLMRRSGYVVIAFKADNQGAWLIHCHIAFHISRGLGLQILEDQPLANATWPKPSNPAIVNASRVCTNWDAWYTKELPSQTCKDIPASTCFQPDSGV